VSNFERAFLQHIRDTEPEIADQITNAKKGMSDDTKAALDGHIETVKKTLGLS
jgi:hypothetical protein